MSCDEPELQSNLRREFAEVINRNCAENVANIPDFIIADYLVRCFNVFCWGVQGRDKWYSVHLEPANSFSKTRQPKAVMRKRWHIIQQAKQKTVKHSVEYTDSCVCRSVVQNKK